jgi:hypothetical protein
MVCDLIANQNQTCMDNIEWTGSGQTNLTVESWAVTNIASYSVESYSCILNIAYFSMRKIFDIRDFKFKQSFTPCNK